MLSYSVALGQYRETAAGSCFFAASLQSSAQLPACRALNSQPAEHRKMQGGAYLGCISETLGKQAVYIPPWARVLVGTGTASTGRAACRESYLPDQRRTSPEVSLKSMAILIRRNNEKSGNAYTTHRDRGASNGKSATSQQKLFTIFSMEVTSSRSRGAGKKMSRMGSKQNIV